MCDTLKKQSEVRPYRIIADSLVVEAVASEYGAEFFGAMAKNLTDFEIKNATRYLSLHNAVEATHMANADTVMLITKWTKTERADIDIACNESRRRFHDFLAQFAEFPS
jgi:hypothetical protein